MNEKIKEYLLKINKSILEIDDQELFNSILFGYATSNKNITKDPICVSWDIKFETINIGDEVYPGRTLLKHNYQPELKDMNFNNDFKKVVKSLKDGLIKSFEKDSVNLMVEDYNPYKLISEGRISFDCLLEKELFDVLSKSIDDDMDLYFDKSKLSDYNKSIANIFIKNIDDKSQYNKLKGLLSVEVTYNLLMIILNNFDNVSTKLSYSLKFIDMVYDIGYKIPARSKKQIIELFDFISSTTDYEIDTVFYTLKVIKKSFPSISIEMTVEDIPELESYLDSDISVDSIAIVNKDSLNLLFNKEFYKKEINLEFDKLIVNNDDEATFELLISSLSNFIDYTIASEKDDDIIQNAIFIKESLLSITTVNSVKNKKFIRLK